jgi:hypothetical protein
MHATGLYDYLSIFRLSNLQVILILFSCLYFIFDPLVITSCKATVMLCSRDARLRRAAVVSAPVSHFASITLNIFYRYSLF